jgi:hypothetical protein
MVIDLLELLYHEDIWWSGVIALLFLSLVLDGVELSVSCLGCSTLGERVLDTTESVS